MSDRNKINKNGFEDIFEEIIEKDTIKDKEELIIAEKQELQTFLEQEQVRLIKLENFLAVKIGNKVNFSQSEKLIKTQSKRKKELRRQIAQVISKPDSIFYKNLVQMFNSHFS